MGETGRLLRPYSWPSERLQIWFGVLRPSLDLHSQNYLTQARVSALGLVLLPTLLALPSEMPVANIMCYLPSELTSQVYDN